MNDSNSEMFQPGDPLTAVEGAVGRSLEVKPFDFQLRTRMVFGPDSIDRLGELMLESGGRRTLVVTDPGIVAAGHVQRGLDSLGRAGVEAFLFDGAHENPTTEDVAAGLKLAHQFQIDSLVGLGGGSSLDCAKGINFLYTNGGQMQDYWGEGKADRPMLPMIAVPTTAGTGSEMQSFALISDPRTHVKMACGDKKASCRVAILDPLLTLTQPAMVTALTGVDALSHAIETFVTLRRTPISLLYSRAAFELLATNLLHVVNDPEHIHARAAMQLGAAYAGLAIENSMLGAAHALANPLTAKYDMAHGQAVGVMLPHVIRFNSAVVNSSYQELLVCLQGHADAPDASRGGQALAEFVTRRIASTGLQVRLQALGVPREDLPELARQAVTQWTGQFNPRPVDEASLLELYEQAW